MQANRPTDSTPAISKNGKSATSSTRPPIEVELVHPFVGRARVLAQEIDENGLRIELPTPTMGFKTGTSVKVSPCHHSLIESRPTPSVKMQVTRVTGDRIELAFSNKSSAHLWKSVDFDHRELDTTADLFRLFQAAAIQRSDGAVLLTQQNGRWLFPGLYLAARQDWQTALQDFLVYNLSLAKSHIGRALLIDNQPEVAAGCVATLFMLHEVSIDAMTVELTQQSKYSRSRWVKNTREVDELSFSDEKLRSVVLQLLAKSAGRDAQHMPEPLMQSTDHAISSLEQDKNPSPIAALRAPQKS